MIQEYVNQIYLQLEKPNTHFQNFRVELHHENYKNKHHNTRI